MFRLVAIAICMPFISLVISCGDTKIDNESALENISNYSYPVFTFNTKDGTVNQATGFFYLKNKTPYLVTNYHIIGMNPFKKSADFSVNLLYILYPIEGMDSIDIIKIPIGTDIQKDTNQFSIIEGLDLYKIEIKSLP